MKSVLYHGAWISLVGLIALLLAWELVLAPVRPGGSWLVLKVLPLLAPLRGALHARRYTYQWATMLSLAYVAEGIVRAWAEPSPVRVLAVCEIVLATAFFLCAALAARTPGRTSTT